MASHRRRSRSSPNAIESRRPHPRRPRFAGRRPLPSGEGCGVADTSAVANGTGDPTPLPAGEGTAAQPPGVGLRLPWAQPPGGGASTTFCTTTKGGCFNHPLFAFASFAGRTGRSHPAGRRYADRPTLRTRKRCIWSRPPRRRRRTARRSRTVAPVAPSTP